MLGVKTPTCGTERCGGHSWRTAATGTLRGDVTVRITLPAESGLNVTHLRDDAGQQHVGASQRTDQVTCPTVRVAVRCWWGRSRCHPLVQQTHLRANASGGVRPSGSLRAMLVHAYHDPAPACQFSADTQSKRADLVIPERECPRPKEEASMI